MTEKRYSHDAIVIVDHLKKDLIYIDGKDELLELAEYVDRLQKENEQIRQVYTQLKHRHSLLHDVCIDAECDRDSYRKDVALLEKENKQLKQDKKRLIGYLHRYGKVDVEDIDEVVLNQEYLDEWGELYGGDVE